MCRNKPPETTTFDVKGPHTREKEEDLFTKEELPTDNKMVAKYEYTHSGNEMKSRTETADVPRILAYMDEAYKKKSAVPETSTHNDPPTMTSQARWGPRMCPLRTWRGRSLLYERTRTASTSQVPLPTTNRPTAWQTRRSLEARHDCQRLRGAGGA